VRLYKTTTRFWKKTNPELRNSDISHILNVLEHLDEIEDLQEKYDSITKMYKSQMDNIIEDLNNKINLTIGRYQESLLLITKYLEEVNEYLCKEEYDKAFELLVKKNKAVDKAYDLFYKLDEIWPGMMKSINKD